MAEIKKVERCFNIFVNHPIIQALGLLSLGVIVLGAIAYQLYDDTSFQREKIELEYEKYVKSKNNYKTFIEDVAKTVIKDRIEVNNFEAIYIENKLKTIKELSTSDAFNNDDIKMIKLTTILLKNHFNELKNFFYRTDDIKLKKKILDSFAFICKQNKIQTYTYTQYKFEKTYEQYITYIDKDTNIFSQQKLVLLFDILNFIGKNSYNLYNYTNLYIDFLNKFNNSFQSKDLKIMETVKKVSTNSFKFFVIYNSVSNISELEKILSFATTKKIFDNTISIQGYRNLLTLISKISLKKSLEEKILTYNRSIYESWLNKNKQYFITIQELTLHDIKSRNIAKYKLKNSIYKNQQLKKNLDNSQKSLK